MKTKAGRPSRHRQDKAEIARAGKPGIPARTRQSIAGEPSGGIAAGRRKRQGRSRDGGRRRRAGVGHKGKGENVRLIISGGRKVKTGSWNHRIPSKGQKRRAGSDGRGRASRTPREKGKGRRQKRREVDRRKVK